MNSHLFGFEKLVVWQQSKDLVLLIYKTTKGFPKEEKYGIVDQVKRAAVSVSANIAEGTSRFSGKEQAHFSQMAYSSLMEVLSHLYVANGLGYLKESDLDDIKKSILEISNLLNALRNYQIKRSEAK